MLESMIENIRENADLDKLKGSIKIVIEDEGVIRLDGAGVTNDDREADCQLMVTTPVFQEILAGLLDPCNGYYQGKLDITGDDALLRNLSSVLAPGKERQRERIPRFAATDSVDAIVAAMRRHGAAIVETVASHELVDRVSEELRPHFDRNGRYDESDFNGYGKAD